MTNEEIRKLVADSVKTAVDAVRADLERQLSEVQISIPSLPDLSGYAKREELPDLSGYAAAADISALNGVVNSLRSDLGRYEGELAMRVDTGNIPDSREDQRRDLWLTRVLEKFHGSERPTNDELAAPAVADVNVPVERVN